MKINQLAITKYWVSKLIKAFTLGRVVGAANNMLFAQAEQGSGK